MSAQTSSITRNGKTEPFALQVARGQIAQHSAINIFGYQASIGTSFIPIWETAATYPTYLTSPSVMTIGSNSASDVGATIIVNGLDKNFNPISEIVIMASGGSGATATTVNSYLRIQGLVLNTPAGSQKTNIGQITCTATNTNVYAYINAGIGKSQMAVYTVPNNCNFYFTQVTINTNNAYTASGTSTLVYQAVSYNSISGAQLSVLQEPFVNNFIVTKSIPFQFGPKTDIQYQLKIGTGTVGAGIVVEGYQVFNSDSGSA